MLYKITDSPTLAYKSFLFLISEYGYKLIKESSSNMGFLFVYQSAHGKVGVTYDYRDNDFRVDLIWGKDTPYYSDEEYWINIKPLSQLVLKYDSTYDTNQLETEKKDHEVYPSVLLENAAMLQKYGARYLNGEEWF